MSVQQENTTAAMLPLATTPLVHITVFVRKDILVTDETAQARIYHLAARWRIILPYHFTANQSERVESTNILTECVVYKRKQ